MPKMPKQRVKDPTIIRKCNYCENHLKENQPSVPLRGHGTCQYNDPEHFKICRPCSRNSKKTEKMQKWRENHSSTNQNPTDVVPSLIKQIDATALQEFYQVPLNKDIEPAEIENMEDDAIEQVLATASMNVQLNPVAPAPTQALKNHKDNEFTLAALPPNFPECFLKKEDVIKLRNIIESKIDKIPSTKSAPKFFASFWEAGFWKIICGDASSRDWFAEEASKLKCFLNGTEESLRVISIQDLPTYKFAVRASGKIVDDDKILKRFQKQNYNLRLQTSRWNHLQCIPLNERGYVLFLDIDPLSYEKIKGNNFALSFGMEEVHFETYKWLDPEIEEISP